MRHTCCASHLYVLIISKYDFDLMAELAGNTAGTLKKYLPKTKTKAIEIVPAFGNFINGTSSGSAGKTAANKGTKRKAEDTDAEATDNIDNKAEGSDEGAPTAENKDEPVKKKVAGKGKGRGKKAADQEGEEKGKPTAKPRGKKTQAHDEPQGNGDDDGEKQKPTVKKPRGKAAAKKVKTLEKDADEPAEEMEEDQADNDI